MHYILLGWLLEDTVAYCVVDFNFAGHGGKRAELVCPCLYAYNDCLRQSSHSLTTSSR